MDNNTFLDLDDRKIDNLIYTKLIDRGYVPSLEEAQATTDIFFELLFELGILFYSEDEEEDGV